MALLSFMTAALLAGALDAPGVAACGPACPPCPVQTTILVPQIVFENRTVTTLCHRPEVRQRAVTVYRTVCETRDVPCEYTVVVPQTRTRQVFDPVERPEYHAFAMRTTLAVPHTETRAATHMVARLVPVQEQRTVCESAGHWELRSASAVPYAVGYGGDAVGTQDSAPPPALPEPPAGQTFRHPASHLNDSAAASAGASPACASCPAGGACGCPCTARVWVPQTVQRTVNVTVFRPVCEPQTDRYPVTVFHPESSTRNVQFVTYRTELVPREEQYTVLVPERRVKIEQVQVSRTVPVEELQSYTVMVPYEECRQVRVPVCRWVPQTVALPLPADAFCR
jgi:hypothetical protein